MKIAVAGGTGTLGAHIVRSAEGREHEVTVLTRSQGTDVRSGSGLEDALAGHDSVIDALNYSTLSAKKSIAFFEQTSKNLLNAAAKARVGHAVMVSIVGIDRNPNNYFAGKLIQEQIYQQSEAPHTILRATQFHEFAGQMLAQAKVGPLRIAPRAKIQPVAAEEAALRLIELAEGPPSGQVSDLAGPRPEELSELVRAYAEHTGVHGPLVPMSLPGAQMKGMRAGLNLPETGATLGTMTFAQWLAGQPRG
ncbi:SDR family oxidoreductase [Nesterenkonia ebinurensis]|uniref:SDR family oxidoreductase n=1 Tax=Nesterenkonia ebinurensis TaxID=2608252 RepID=UPI00123CF5A3|nr:NAD(P)H-binding protein [Nesterenkonia ebinurensis]